MAEPKNKTHIATIYNCSKQMIPLQVRPPGSDFYTNEQQIRLMPGQDVQLPKTYIRQEQIDNLCARGMIKVVYDSQLRDERESAVEY
jgi:hypothetical protein